MNVRCYAVSVYTRSLRWLLGNRVDRQILWVVIRRLIVCMHAY
jgi:hypothetical protein